MPREKNRTQVTTICAIKRKNLKKGKVQNGYENYDNLLDSSEGTIIDSNVDPIVARAYSSSLILDSNGQPIDGRVIFCIK